MRNFTLTQTGQEVQDILNKAVVYGTTSYWESLPDLVPVEGQIVVYSDYATNEPGLKVGDGVTSVESLAFLGAGEAAALMQHIEDTVRHITAAERSAWNAKQDAEPGKGLSTEDYTTAEKEKLAGIEAGADRSVNADWDASSGKAEILHKPDLSQFVTKTVNDLVYYYLKSEVYTKEEVAQLLSAITTGFWQVVPYLPEASADTFGFKIYLVPSQEPQSQNVKDEYITVRSGDPSSYTYSWELIGSTAIDLSDYVTNEALQTALEGYVSTEAFQQSMSEVVLKVKVGNVEYTPSNGTVSLPAYPTTLPASDVYAWAKAANKPSYNFSEIGSKPDTLSGYGITDAKIVGGVVTLGNQSITPYEKPSGGIPSSDMSPAVQTSLGKADTALQSFTETDPTVPSWAKAQNPPTEIFWATYGTTTASEIDAAVAAGKVVACIYNNRTYQLGYCKQSDQYIGFYSVGGGATHALSCNRHNDSWAASTDSYEKSNNRTSDIESNKTSTSKYTSAKGVADYVTGIAANKQHRYSVATEQIAYPKEGDISEVAPVFTQISPTHTDTSEGSAWARTNYRTYDLTSFSTTKRIKATDTGSGIEGHGFHSYVNADNETVLISDDPYTVILPVGVKSVKMFAMGGIGDEAVASADIYEETTPTVIKEYINGEWCDRGAAPEVPVQDVTVGGTSVVNASGVAEVPAIPETVQAQEIEIDSTPTANSTNLVTSGGVKSYVDGAIPSVPVTDVTVGGTSVVSSGTAAIPAMPTLATGMSAIKIWAGTQAEYDLLTPASDTLYFIKES